MSGEFRDSGTGLSRDWILEKLGSTALDQSEVSIGSRDLASTNHSSPGAQLRVRHVLHLQRLAVGPAKYYLKYKKYLLYCYCANLVNWAVDTGVLQTGIGRKKDKKIPENASVFCIRKHFHDLFSAGGESFVLSQLGSVRCQMLELWR